MHLPSLAKYVRTRSGPCEKTNALRISSARLTSSNWESSDPNTVPNASKRDPSSNKWSISAPNNGGAIIGSRRGCGCLSNGLVTRTS